MGEKGYFQDLGTLLEACGFIGATKKGIKLHAKVIKKGLLRSNYLIGIALADMYALKIWLHKDWAKGRREKSVGKGRLG